MFMWSRLRFPKRVASAAKTRRRFVPVLEQLEPRLALTGNVAAIVSAGNLIVTGDNLGADITVSQPDAGQITLAGNGSEVNGSTAPVTFSGVTRDLRINFGNGHNALTFDETNPLPCPATCPSAGAKAAIWYPRLPGSGSLNVGGNLSILDPSGTGTTQLITLLNLNVQGNVQIQNTGGNAIVTIAAASAGGAFPANVIGGDLLITNGPGSGDGTDLSSST